MAWYHNLPQMIDPVAVQLGNFAVRWYGLMWLAGFFVVWALLVWRVRRGEVQRVLAGMRREDVSDVVIAAFFGAVLGGRIGYVLFYNFAYFAAHPLAVISPVVDGRFVGISGMSFHGGVVGAALALWVFARRRKWSLLALTDFALPAVPLGYLFGRIGNFLNGELWGRVTDSVLGMYFAAAPDGGALLRYPSQLLEAFCEGSVLFAVLWPLRMRLARWRGMMTGLFLCGYSIARFVVEFVRAPDVQLGFVAVGLTMGQLLSLGMMGVGVVLLCTVRIRGKRNA